MKRTFLYATSALLLFAGAAVAQSVDRPGHESPRPGTNSEAMSAIKDSTAGVVGKASAELTTSTKGFVTAAAISDMYEVEAGRIAEQRAQSPAVKDFAREMVEAHTGTTSQLKSLLAKGDIDVTPPAHVDMRRQGMLDDLRGAKSQDFDHRYVSQQVAAHREADILMRGYAKEGDSRTLKEFAAATDHAVKMHLSKAEKLDKAVKTASN
ncbi:MAG TPA: DUF4142 domain-containing protein [Rhizomicrobium sp.]|nr:DUF4142 domain-containing protein [Rhizomicrobium sp.]